MLFCLDTNVIVDALVKVEGTYKEKENIDPDVLYSEILKCTPQGADIVLAQSVVDEIDKLINPRSSKVPFRLQKLTKYYRTVKEMISKHFKILSLSDSEQREVKNKKKELFSYRMPNGEEKNIYTDYRVAKECISNGVSNIISRNIKDFVEVEKYDPSLKIRVTKPNSSLYTGIRRKRKRVSENHSLARKLLERLNTLRI